MRNVSGLQARVLETIKNYGPISVRQIMDHVASREKNVRSAIDRLRSVEEPIWLDTQVGFWWRSDRKPSPVADGIRWKRRFEP